MIKHSSKLKQILKLMKRFTQTTVLISICIVSLIVQLKSKTTFSLLKNKNILNKQEVQEQNIPNISIGHPHKDQYDDLIIKAAQKFDLDPLLIKAVIAVESSFNHRAVSNAGAKGLMQLMPYTAQILDVHDVFDAESNIYGGTRHIRGLLNRYKSIENALGFYYAGNKYRKQPQIGHIYISKVLGKYYRFKELNSSICKLDNNRNAT
jgi:soluble lytic murein transglycosylase-like protein